MHTRAYTCIHMHTRANWCAGEHTYTCIHVPIGAQVGIEPAAADAAAEVRDDLAGACAKQ